jgi:aminopeptidase N
VHELAHQWFGDLLRVDSWRHIWLNEGFATYMEFLWFEHIGAATTQEIFDFFTGFPADDPFWRIATANPGPNNIFDTDAIYVRGALALHALRLEVGDRAFFRILRTWVAEQAGGTVRTGEFTGLAERISGRQLDGFFREWLFNASRPPSLPDAAAGAAATTASSGAVDRLVAALGAGSRR